MQTTIQNYNVFVPMDSLEKREVCSYCNSIRANNVASFENSRTINLVRCQDCQLVSTEYVPKSDFLEWYYLEKFPEFVGKHNKGKLERVTFSRPARFAKHLSKSLSRHINISNPLKILDFGGADGSLAIAVALKLNGSGQTRITVVDFGSELANSPKANIQLTKRSSLPDSESFDLIIASSSLEMLPNFGEFLQKLLRALSQEGALYIRTNFILPFLTPFNLGQFSFPAHLHDIGPDFWECFAANCKSSFSVVMSGTSISEVDFRGFPIRFVITNVLKLPARLEALLFPRRLKKVYKFVGAWEVLVIRNRIQIHE